MENKFNVNENLINHVWEDEKKGLRKELINFNFISIEKASELSKCRVDFENIQNLSHHKSNYLKEEQSDVWIEIGHAITAIDCYVEEFLKEMLINETSKCSIKTKSTGEISFIIRLKEIKFNGYYSEQTPTQMFELARLYKENGVKMFKEFPLFAHNYFNLSAKCLLSFQTQDVDYDELLKDSTITKKDFDELLQNVYLNIAACLIKQERFEEIPSILEFVRVQDNPPEKGVFRLATAYLHIGNLEEAENVIKKVNYQGNKELMTLMAKIKQNRKVENEQLSVMAKKMLFG